MAHSVYERVIIGHMLDGMTTEQLRRELIRADAEALSTSGPKHIVNMTHVANIRNHLIRRL